MDDLKCVHLIKLLPPLLGTVLLKHLRQFSYTIIFKPLFM